MKDTKFLTSETHCCNHCDLSKFSKQSVKVNATFKMCGHDDKMMPPVILCEADLGLIVYVGLILLFCKYFIQNTCN